LIDDQLPLKIYEKVPNPAKPNRKVRGDTFDPAEVEDYWALLLEKVLCLLRIIHE